MNIGVHVMYISVHVMYISVSCVMKCISVRYAITEDFGRDHRFNHFVNFNLRL